MFASLNNVLYVCVLNLKTMDSIAEIETKINVEKEKRKQLILTAMDGRTQKYIAVKAGIDEPKLSKWINGFGGLDATEVHRISIVLGVDFK